MRPPNSSCTTNNKDHFLALHETAQFSPLSDATTTEDRIVLAIGLGSNWRYDRVHNQRRSRCKAER